VAEALRKPITLSSHSLPRCTCGALLETSEIGPKLHRNQATLSQKSFVKYYIFIFLEESKEKKERRKREKDFVAGKIIFECMTGHHRSGYAVMASRRLALAVLITALTFATCETAQESAEALNRKIRAAFTTKSKGAATTGTTASARGEAVPDAGMHGSTRHVMSATPSPPGDVVSASTTSANSDEPSEPKTAGRMIHNGSILATCCQ
jgi:hypothetical protein